MRSANSFLYFARLSLALRRLPVTVSHSRHHALALPSGMPIRKLLNWVQCCTIFIAHIDARAAAKMEIENESLLHSSRTDRGRRSSLLACVRGGVGPGVPKGRPGGSPGAPIHASNFGEFDFLQSVVS